MPSSTLIVCRAISFPIFAPFAMGKMEEGEKAIFFAAAEKMALPYSRALASSLLQTKWVSQEEKQEPHFLGC